MASGLEKKREQLKGKSTSFKDALTKNIDDIKNGSVDISNAALIGGGILLGGYLLYKLIAGNNHHPIIEENDKIVVVQNANQDSFVVRSIKQSIATFLLAIARQKLMEYLNSREEEAVE